MYSIYISIQEAALILALPHLVFKLRNKKNEKQAFFFLMSSDYERSNWKEAIKGLQNRKSCEYTYYVQSLVLY